MSDLIHELIFKSADRIPDAEALVYRKSRVNYSMLAQEVRTAGCSMLALGLDRGERVGVYLEKRPETVIALFGAAAAGGVFVPINPLLKPEQVAYILRDCNVRILVTSGERLKLLAAVLPQCHDLRAVIVASPAEALPVIASLKVIAWEDALSQPGKAGKAGEAGEVRAHRRIDGDMAAILYTSGSTGKPKGVVLSHRNLTAGAASVAQYLKNGPDDRILSVLPLSFDYGLNQLTTAFRVGATGVLMNYLMPRD
ncbi:MAG: AMP-binding protein, partial [Betaproteobacteria bacterium]|nr:AMP-binding protein [Betaproteobacteria bacterium]